MSELVRSLSLRDPATRRQVLERRWLVTNGLGGFASGTLHGVLGSRYHGLLIAALGAPLGRVVMLNHLVERVCCGGGPARIIGGVSLVCWLSVITFGRLLTFYRPPFHWCPWC